MTPTEALEAVNEFRRQKNGALDRMREAELMASRERGAVSNLLKHARAARAAFTDGSLMPDERAKKALEALDELKKEAGDRW